MTLPDQWKYLSELAEQRRLAGDTGECQKLLQCSATIKDIWLEAHREMMDSLGYGEETVVQRDVTVKTYQMQVHKSKEVFNDEK